MDIVALAKWLEDEYSLGYRFYRIVEMVNSINDRLNGYDVECAKKSENFSKSKRHYKQIFQCSELTKNFMMQSKNIISFIKKQKLQEDFNNVI